MLNNELFDLAERSNYVGPPGADFMIDTAHETAPRNLALQALARERDVLYRDRLRQSGSSLDEPTNLRPGAGGLTPPPADFPSGGEKPPPSAAPLQTNPAAARAASAAPRLLSPPEWLRRFMPNLADQRKISKRQWAMMQQGYAAYQASVGNAQQQARYGRQDQLADEQMGLRREELGVRREELGARIAAQSRRTELSPQDAAFKAAFDQEYARNPDDPVGALSSAAGAAKGGTGGATMADPMGRLTAEAIAEMKAEGKPSRDILGELAAEKRRPKAEESLLDKGSLDRDLYGDAALGTPGWANHPLWDTDPVQAFERLAQFVQTRMSTASSRQGELLRKLLRQKAPWKTPQEIRGAWQAGQFDPQPEQKSMIDYLFRGRGPAVESPRSQGARKADEYLRLLFTPEELSAAQGTRNGG